jgi:hypothetical protein
MVEMRDVNVSYSSGSMSNWIHLITLFVVFIFASRSKYVSNLAYYMAIFNCGNAKSRLDKCTV